MAFIPSLRSLRAAVSRAESERPIEGEANYLPLSSRMTYPGVVRVSSVSRFVSRAAWRIAHEPIAARSTDLTAS